MRTVPRARGRRRAREKVTTRAASKFSRKEQLQFNLIVIATVLSAQCSQSKQASASRHSRVQPRTRKRFISDSPFEANSICSGRRHTHVFSIILYFSSLRTSTHYCLRRWHDRLMGCGVHVYDTSKLRNADFFAENSQIFCKLLVDIIFFNNIQSFEATRF